jgi:heat shock protein HtpX
MRNDWYGKDIGLSVRIFFTMAALAIVYLAFITILFVLGVDILVISLFVGLFLVIQLAFSDRLVVLSAGGRIVSEQEAPELHDIVTRLCSMGDLPKPKIAIVRSSVPNAFATGKGKKSSVVAVTTALMDTLDKSELEAVIAHELTHIANRDAFVMSVAGFMSTIAWYVARFSIYMRRGRDRDNGSGVIIWLVSIAVWFLSFLLIRALSRYREFSADRGSALLTGNPSALISALLKISGDIRRVPERDLREVEGISAFFIVPAAVKGIFSTHPPTEKRIERLRQMEREMEGIA